MRTQFTIEMDDADADRYGIVHLTGCRHLLDPEPLGSDWRAGVAALGTDWELEVVDGAVRLAPCARRATRR
ncbi:hypothetical protein [Leucobacter chromiireducens]|uniref:hypothetical protein n=1 Tax=Leucobacter chromiireducens TaxID=283877 RepID=UPI003F7E9CEF